MRPIKIITKCMYYIMNITLLYFIITLNDNLFNNGTIGIQTLFICFSISIITGLITIKLRT